MKFKLHYRCINQGDGSVCVNFHENNREACDADDEHNETGDGWAESSVDYVEIKLEDGKLFYSDYKKVNGKYAYVWHPLEEVK